MLVPIRNAQSKENVKGGVKYIKSREKSADYVKNWRKSGRIM